MSLKRNDLLQVYEWFMYIRQTNPAHLSDTDMKLAKRIRKELLDLESKSK